MLLDALVNTRMSLEVRKIAEVQNCEWQIRRGTRAGDSTGTDVFNDTYDAAIYEYKKWQEQRGEVLRIEYDGKLHDVGLVKFVDDIHELKIAVSAEQMDDMAKLHTDKLREELKKVGADLEPTKELVVMRWMEKPKGH